jgi:tripartite-type tricarboxylate transporter receptor subunit TctC
MITRRIAIGLAATAMLAPAAVCQARAQSWPNRFVRLVVPFPPGGGTDAIARVVAGKLSDIWGQQMVVENRGGGATNIGTEAVVRSDPDGYTVLLQSMPLAVNRFLFPSLNYDPVGDLAPVSLLCDYTNIMAVPITSPARSVTDFIAYAKANKGKLNFGSAGTGSATHLGCVLFNSMAGIEAAHVPYRGSGPAMNDIIGGQIQYLCDVVSTGKPQIDAGTVKAVAFLGKERSPVLPNLATASEQGLKGFEAYTWNAIFVAKGTPPEIVKKLNDAALAAINDADVKKRLGDLGAQIVGSDRATPEYLGVFVKSEIDKWAAPIKASGARVE